MSSHFEVTAKLRQDMGKGASRRLRREQDLVPAIVYGAKQDPVPLTLEHRHIVKCLENEAFYASILNLNIDGKSEQVVLKDLQRHPYKPYITHVDFLRVSATEALTMNVPLHFIGADDAPGVKEGGVLSHNQNEIEIRCLPKDLPEYIEVDVTELGMDETIHMSALKLPKGVEIVALALGPEHDDVVASIHKPKVVVEEPPETEGEAAEGEAGEAAEGGEEKSASEEDSSEKKED